MSDKQDTASVIEAWAVGYAFGIMSTAECTSGGMMNCQQCKYSSEYNPEHKSQLECKKNMVKQGLKIIDKIVSEAKA